MLDSIWWILNSFHMKTIQILLMTFLASVALADDSEMSDFVGGVYRQSGCAVVLDKDTAIVNGKLITRDRDLFATPKGVYVNDKGNYSGPTGVVVKDRDIFDGKGGTVMGNGSFYSGSGVQTFVISKNPVVLRKP